MRIALLALVVAAAGCVNSSTTPTDDRQGPPAAKADDSAHRAKLLEIAAKYKTYEKVSDRMRLAPVPCAPAMLPTPDYRLSRSDDEATHGRKLYILYAAKVDPLFRSYTPEEFTINGKAAPSLTDQVIVKESWHAAAMKPNEKWPASAVAATGPDGKAYRKIGQGPLFVMYQTDPKDPLADDGWVYGTLTADGKTVTGVGRLENCMGCHQKAPHGRLFGLPKE